MGNKFSSHYASSSLVLDRSDAPSKRTKETLHELYALSKKLDQYPVLVDTFINMAKTLTVNDLNSTNPGYGSILHVLCTHTESQPVLEAINALIEMGVDCNIEHPSTKLRPLDSACLMTNSENVIKILINADSNVNAVGNDTHSVLTRTLKHYNDNRNQSTLNIIKILIEAGANVNFKAKSSFDETPLLIACRTKNNYKLVEFLIEHGAQVNCRAIDLNTPLHYLAYYSWNIQTFGLLIKHGSDINARNKWKRTPLMITLEHRTDFQLGCVQTLLANGADISLVDVNGNNALMLGLRWNVSQPVIYELIGAGIDIFQKNNEGEDVYMWAVNKYGYDDPFINVLLAEHSKSIESKKSGGPSVQKVEMKEVKLVKVKSQCKEDQKICSICWEVLEKEVWRTPCGHEFHNECFTQLVKNYSSNSCPMCRRDLFMKK